MNIILLNKKIMNLQDLKQKYDSYKNITPEIALEAVKKYASALQYVKGYIFKGIVSEYTMEELVNKLGYEFKIKK